MHVFLSPKICCNQVLTVTWLKEKLINNVHGRVWRRCAIRWYEDDVLRDEAQQPNILHVCCLTCYREERSSYGVLGGRMLLVEETVLDVQGDNAWRDECSHLHSFTLDRWFSVVFWEVADVTSIQHQHSNADLALQIEGRVEEGSKDIGRLNGIP